MRSTSDQRLARRARASKNRPAISAVRNTTSMLGIAKRSPASVPTAPTMIISAAPRAALRETRDGVQRSNRLARRGSSASRHCSIAARRRRSWWLSIAPRFAPGWRSQPGSLPAGIPRHARRGPASPPPSRPTFGVVADRQIILGAGQDRGITLSGGPRSSGAGLCGPRCPCRRRCALPSWTCSTHPRNQQAVRRGARAEIRRQVWTLIDARHRRNLPSWVADTDLRSTIVIGDGCHGPNRVRRQVAGLQARGVIAAGRPGVVAARPDAGDLAGQLIKCET